MWVNKLSDTHFDAFITAFESRSVAFDDDMPTFYRAVIALAAMQPSNIIQFPSAGQRSKPGPKSDKADVPDEAELVAKMRELVELRHLVEPDNAEAIITSVNPCVAMMMWEPEVGREGNQQERGRHIHDAVKRLRAVEIIDEAELADVFRFLCHLTMDDGESPGEVDRCIQDHYRKLSGPVSKSSPSCTACKAKGLCNATRCGEVAAGWIRMKGVENAHAAGIVPLCITAHEPTQLIVKIGDRYVAFHAEEGKQIKTIADYITNNFMPLMRLPSQVVWYNMLTPLPHLTFAEILVQTNGVRVKNHFSQDLKTHRYFVSNYFIPAIAIREANKQTKDAPTFIQNQLIAVDDTTVYVHYDTLQDVAFEAIAKDGGRNHMNGTTSETMLHLWTRGDTKAASFRDRIKVPLLPKGRWCQIARADIEAITHATEDL